MRRLVSHSEITMALECMAKHSFAYTGHLTGGMVLKPRVTAVRLRAGSAWGRGVAAFHGAIDSASGVLGSDPVRHGGVARFDSGTVGPAPSGSLHVRYAIGLLALNASLDEDAAAMREHGVYDQAEHHDLSIRLADELWHYACTAEPLTISDPEFELMLPIPSRSGRGVSNKYSFHGFVDGLASVDGRLWIAEYKRRDSLSDFSTLVNARQGRRYVWAAERVIGREIAGVIYDERLAEAPKPARWVKAKRKGEGVDGRTASHAKDQLTTSTLYVEACAEAGVDPDPDTVAALDARRWQQRHRVMYTRAEIEEAGRELVSAAQLIAQLDSGALWPVRNTAPWRCRGCQFAEICGRPGDTELVDLNYVRKPPKRLRPAVEAAAS